jgi:short-subunit dehydrogenase
VSEPRRQSSAAASSVGFRKALLTGAAGDLGSGLARALAERGVALVLIDLDQRALAALAADLGTRVAVASYAIDQTDLDGFESLLRNVVGEHPDVDLVIANAGIDVPQSITAPDWRLAKRHFDVNAISNYVLFSVFVPHFVTRGSGHVAAIVSLGGLLGFPYAHAYNASKAALRMMIDGLRAETLGTGVTWTAVFPGFLEGRMAAGNAWRQPYRVPMDEAAQRILGGVLARRAVVAFPWRAVWQARLATLLPVRVRDRIARSVMKSGRELETRLSSLPAEDPERRNPDPAAGRDV